MSIQIIAEMACSHEGDPALARKIIDAAGSAEADAIQFQIWQLSQVLVPHHPDYARNKPLELTQNQWSELAEYTRSRYKKMQIIACVYDMGGVDFCESIEVNAYKIHSADLSNPYLIRHVAQTSKRIDLSVGGSTSDEIKNAISWIRETSQADIWLMYGYQNFPTRVEDVCLGDLMELKQEYGLRVGYQDHSDADTEATFWLPAAVVGMGVDIVEKHITHNRSLKGIDHEAALNPDEFGRFVKMIRLVDHSMRLNSKESLSAAASVYRRYAKKSIVANRPLPAGTVLTEDQLSFMRADRLGLAPDETHKILGKKTKRNILAYHVILEEDLS